MTFFTIKHTKQGYCVVCSQEFLKPSLLLGYFVQLSKIYDMI